MPDNPGCRSPSIRNDRCSGFRDEYYLAHLRPFESGSFPSLGDHANGVLRSDKMLLRIRFLLALLGLTISFAPPAFAQQKDTVDAETAQQVRALASNYDAAFNRQDAVAVAALYAENAAFNAPEGTFHGRQAIEELYAKRYFGEAHSRNVVTVVNEVIAAGNEVRATGTWSDTFEEPSTGIIHAEGTYSWVLLHEDDSWRILESTYDITNMRP
jgi:uncharacterized protein (TIGR02246 family)